MTDHTLTGLPTEVLTLIGQNLTTSELAKFKKTCRLFNTLGSDSNFLKPLYHRLYTLDTTLPVALTQQGAILEFALAFKKIRDRQKQEIAFLNERHPRAYRNEEHPQAYRVEIDALLAITGNTIEKLEERNALLNSINSSIIDAAIAEQQGILLNLNYKGLTRFIVTKDKVNYFKNLINLSCANNSLTTLRLEGLTALKALFCDFNQLTSLNVQGLLGLIALNCAHNQLTRLNLQGFVALQSLNCAHNQLTSLSLEKLVALRILQYDNNPLITLNLQGTSPAIQAKCSQLEAILLFRKLSYATASSERVEIIERLGERYTLSNCLKHGCVYEAGMVSYQGAASAVYTGFYSVVNRMPRFLPSFTSRSIQNEKELNQTTEQKRKREEDDNNEGPEHKKPSPQE